MGCTVSKPGSVEAAQIVGLRPLSSIRRKIIQIKLRQAKDDGLLLNKDPPEEKVEDDATSALDADGSDKVSEVGLDKMTVIKDAIEEPSAKEDIRAEAESEAEVETVAEAETEVDTDTELHSERGERELGFADLPSSPSFRDYCRDIGDSVSDSESKEIATSSQKQTKGTSNKESRRKKSSVDSSEGESKSPKKERGRRFRALAKGPVAVCTRLSVRSCYNPSGSGSGHHETNSSTSHVTRRLLPEKPVEPARISNCKG